MKLESTQGTRYKDDPNKQAKIGFVVFYPFHYYVYKNVYKHIRDEAEFIIDLGAFFPTEQPVELAENMVRLLQKENVNFRILYFQNYLEKDGLERFLSKYETLVSVWMRGCIVHPGVKEKRKVHMTYGASKDLVTYAVGKRIYDLVLSYGKRDYDIFSMYTAAEIVGNPKFDDWFNGNFDSELLENLSRHFDKNKKTILYLPTHGDLSSIDELADELKKIAGLYNTVVKFHYYTPREEPERIKKLQHPDITAFRDDTDLLSLLKIADLVISDNSGAIFDAILADKPLLVTDFLSKEYLDIEHKKPKYYRRGIARVLTYSGSIEQKIKQDKLIAKIENPSQLQEGIRQALKDDKHFKDERKKLRDWLFSFQDGNSGKRAAAAIKGLIGKELPERPLFYHLLEDRKQNRERKRENSRRNLYEYIKNFWKGLDEYFH